MKSIHVFAPATVANVTCGFDVLGFAVEKPGDEVVIELKPRPGITLEVEGDGGKLPVDVTENTVSVAVAKWIEHQAYTGGVHIRLIKNMPLGSGLGSSAASAAAGVFAMNELFGRPLSARELVPFAMEGERLACGDAHADNVAPALLGGFILIRSYDPLDIIELPVPDDLFAVVIHPRITVNTRDARDILRKQIPLSTASRQWGNLAGLIHALHTHDYALMARCMVDEVVEPTRSILIPGFERVKQAALERGALTCGISGSGPSLFALTRGDKDIDGIASCMQDIFNKLKIMSEVYISKVNTSGPRILDL